MNCEHGDHHLHDEGMVADNGECPGLRPEPGDFHPDDELIAEERVERHAEQERNLDHAYAADATFRVQRWAIYGDLVEVPDAEDLAALQRVGLAAEEVIWWLPARAEDVADGRAR
ncbi:hypothetical protein K1T35_48275 (plasmid) [Pseudonocardia sp. DSM 110487]|uniref:hypothetical protein n=1 Tax=Pseudonocardia sp. DSM 110487 TaxID=2865833 RepID=UPI001C6A3100|nr:hypothetical protein [Pseudonocardia sp. DSM 110487]QYN41146.1 hypothetical protein K1T35_48275 [Pseudonocardia sp. DSM 110487]